ncbi:hypothetical protein [Comamonas jiangduensis]|uniref:hypothetical protein n=1 Tax=Comamonas jiangduensis TaxID=1194168 RepID=UPI003BF84691
MELETYKSRLQELSSQLTNVMNQLDDLDPESPLYDSLTDKQIEIQNKLVDLDNQYNAERKKA